MDTTSTRDLMMGFVIKSKQASLLWLEGFREACCLHRVIIYCLRSRELAIRTGQCFLLNGFIFLGSIFVLRSLVIPTLQWVLPDGCPQMNSQETCPYGSIFRFYPFLRLGLIQLFYVFWFYPMYISSFILSTIWYNDIAKYGFFAIKKYGPSGSESSDQKDESATDKAADLEGVMIGIAEQVYSVLLLSFFFLEVYVTGFIPYIGKPVNFLLLSWMYAYYCFEYKWNYSGLSLDKRLDFFESNWPFFAGFGSPCVLAAFFYSPLVSYGVMAILYPLVSVVFLSRIVAMNYFVGSGNKYVLLFLVCIDSHRLRGRQSHCFPKKEMERYRTGKDTNIRFCKLCIDETVVFLPRRTSTASA